MNKWKTITFEAKEKASMSKDLWTNSNIKAFEDVSVQGKHTLGIGILKKWLERYTNPVINRVETQSKLAITIFNSVVFAP